jgi:hypothetical protein
LLTLTIQYFCGKPSPNTGKKTFRGVLPINEGTNLPAFLFGGTDVGQE